MSRGSRLVLALFAGITFVTAGAASADPVRFMNITFQSDAAGAAPSTGPAGTPITTLQAIGGYTATSEINPPTTANGTIVVGDVAGMNNAAILTTNSDNGVLGALYMDTGFSMPSSVISLAFDFSVLAAPTTATAQPKYLDDTNDTAGILFGINAYAAVPGAWAFRFAAAPTSETGGVFAFRSADNSRLITFGNYVEGQAYHLLLTANYGTGTVDAYINDQLALSGHQFWNGGVAGTPTTSEFFFHLNGEEGYSNQVAIDNIQGYNYNPVPEPTSLVLLGTGLLGGARAWRARRR